MKKLLAVVLAVAIPVIALVAISAPLASANGGPHGDYSALTDACAGCHRAHTAPAARLLIAEDPTLCLSCHGAAGVGANTNVEAGLFDNSWAATTALGTLNDPLHGGGFVSWQWNYSDTASYGGVTSVHNQSGPFGPTNAVAVWGMTTTTNLSGTRGVQAGSISGGFRCTACHNPHGSTNWRILQTKINGITVTVTAQGNITSEAGLRYTGLNHQYGAGISAFCGACHSAYHRTTSGQANILDNGTYTHRSERAYGATSTKPNSLEFAGYTGVGDGGVRYTLPFADTNNDGVNDGFTCLTCHVAHGTSAGLRGRMTRALASARFQQGTAHCCGCLTAACAKFAIKSRNTQWSVVGSGGHRVVSPTLEDAGKVLKRNLSRRAWLAIGIGVCAVAILMLLAAIIAQGAPVRQQLPPAPITPEPAVPHFLFSLDKPKDLLLAPMAVTTDAQGNIYVADTGHQVVQVFDQDGKFQRTIGRPAQTRSAGDGELIYPVGLALDDNGQLYVADVQAGRIVTFKPDGAYAGIFGQGVITSPIGLLYHDGQLIVNDIGAQQVVALNAQGQAVQRFGGPGKLAYANYSAVTPNGELAVADSNNNRVAIFAADGSISRTLAAVGADPLLMPRGLGYDAKGRLYVATVFNHQIAVFDPALNFLYTYGQHGSGSGEFNFPNGLWIRGDRVYIADRQNNRVQVWQIPDISQ